MHGGGGRRLVRPRFLVEPLLQTTRSDFIVRARGTSAYRSKAALVMRPTTACRMVYRVGTTSRPRMIAFGAQRGSPGGSPRTTPRDLVEDEVVEGLQLLALLDRAVAGFVRCHKMMEFEKSLLPRLPTAILTLNFAGRRIRFPIQE